MNNNILIGHLGMDGAHFLSACLTMNDKVYLNNLTVRGKTEYYFKYMSRIAREEGKPVWSDVPFFFAGSYQTEGFVHYHQGWLNDFHNNFEQFTPVKKIKNKTLISRLHIPIYYPLQEMMEKNISHPMMDMFRSKYFICLVNPHLFSSLRGIKIETDNRYPGGWDEGFAIIPDMKWYDGPLTEIDEITNSSTISEFKLLPQDLQERVISHRRSNVNELFSLTKLYKSDNDLLKSMITHEWDCNWFLTEDETIGNVKSLYSEMNLGKFNEKLIREMYKIWIRKIDYIKKSHIKP